MASPYEFARAAASSRLGSEDRAEVFAHGDALVVVVADGAGGMRGGAVASDAVVDAVRSTLGRGRIDLYDVGLWSDVLVETDRALARGLGGETTAVVVVVGALGMVGVSAGDSDAWAVSAGAVDRLTELRTRRRVGSGLARPVAFHRRTLEGTLVVGTDGLFKYASPQAIAVIAATAVSSASAVSAVSSAAAVSSVSGEVGIVRAAAAAMVALPRLASGRWPDDVAVVVVASGRDGLDARR